MSTAAKVAEYKRRHPELYCPAPRCLWKTGGGSCPRHGADVDRERSERVRQRLAGFYQEVRR